MALRSLNLPGIGTKYELETEKKDIIAIFFLKSGNIQMYTLPHDSSTPCVAELTPPEARRIGAILSGAIMEADKESVEIAFSALSDLRISVHTYIIGKHCAGTPDQGPDGCNGDRGIPGRAKHHQPAARFHVRGRRRDRCHRRGRSAEAA